MRVLLGLGDVELALALLGDHLGEGGVRLPRREGDRVGPAVPVLGHRRHLERAGAAAVELVEVRLAEGPGQLPCPVGPEVDEDERLIGLGAVVVADHDGLDELVGDLALIGLADRLDGALGPRRPRVDDRVVGALGPVPAAVAIHPPVAAADRADRADVAQPALDLLDVAGAGGRQGVAPVGEDVQDELRDPLLPGELDHRLDVLPARVDAAVGDQADRVQATAPGLAGRTAGRPQRRVLEEAPVGDRVVDPGQVLLDDRARAEVEVARPPSCPSARRAGRRRGPRSRAWRADRWTRARRRPGCSPGRWRCRGRPGRARSRPGPPAPARAPGRSFGPAGSGLIVSRLLRRSPRNRPDRGWRRRPGRRPRPAGRSARRRCPA